MKQPRCKGGQRGWEGSGSRLKLSDWGPFSSLIQELTPKGEDLVVAGVHPLMVGPHAVAEGGFNDDGISLRIPLKLEPLRVSKVNIRPPHLGIDGLGNTVEHLSQDHDLDHVRLFLLERGRLGIRRKESLAVQKKILRLVQLLAEVCLRHLHAGVEGVQRFVLKELEERFYFFSDHAETLPTWV